uniref:Uncharacterized protein n=1 Tax=Magallana gigas TaxID=29159 RepID=A0A8W8L2C1_MAGGI
MNAVDTKYPMLLGPRITNPASSGMHVMFNPSQFRRCQSEGFHAGPHLTKVISRSTKTRTRRTDTVVPSRCLWAPYERTEAGGQPPEVPVCDERRSQEPARLLQRLHQKELHYNISRQERSSVAVKKAITQKRILQNVLELRRQDTDADKDSCLYGHYGGKSLRSLNKDMDSIIAERHPKFRNRSI